MKIRKPRITFGKKGIGVRAPSVRIGGKKVGVNVSKSGASVSAKVGKGTINSKRGCTSIFGLLSLVLASGIYLLFIHP